MNDSIFQYYSSLLTGSRDLPISCASRKPESCSLRDRASSQSPYTLVFFCLFFRQFNKIRNSDALILFTFFPPYLTLIMTNAEIQIHRGFVLIHIEIDNDNNNRLFSVISSSF